MYKYLIIVLCRGETDLLSSGLNPRPLQPTAAAAAAPTAASVTGVDGRSFVLMVPRPVSVVCIFRDDDVEIKIIILVFSRGDFAFTLCTTVGPHRHPTIVDSCCCCCCWRVGGAHRQ